ncbi:MAG: hypothetical protein L3K05_03085 [Thermoplasmata archaeon]|nr:hypothetical protein [Thermoplasmata archaeon]
MADFEGDDSDTEGLPFERLPLSRKIQFWAFASLLVLAAAFYAGWGLSYGVWLDNGVYAVVAVLGLMGIAGMWLTLPNRPIVATVPRS